MTEDNGSFCVMPWLHLHAWPNGEAYLCCVADAGNKESVVGDLSQNSIADIMNNEKMKTVRKDMMEGKKISACKNCYRMEKFKDFSWRKGFNKQFAEHIPKLLSDTKTDGEIIERLLYVDFRFSNFCNLECRTCGAELSSSIAATKGRNFPYSVTDAYEKKGVISRNSTVAYSNKNENFTEDLKQYLPETECLYFAGGEPLIQREHFEVLNYIYENRWFNKELRYSTNLSTLSYKSNDLLEYWKSFDNVWLMCSIDHFGEKLEYIRQNVKHERLWDNFERLMPTNVKMSITFVVSIYNIYYLDEFFQFLKDSEYIDRLYSLEMLYVFGETDAPSVLPDFAKKDLIEKLKKDNESQLYIELFDMFPMLKDAIYGLPEFIYEKNSLSFNDFLSRVYNFDKIYNKDVKKTFPWLKKIIDHFEKE